MEKNDKNLDFNILSIKDGYCEILRKSNDCIQLLKEISAELENNYNEISVNLSEKSKCQSELEHLKTIVSPYIEKISKTENRIKEYEKAIDMEIGSLEAKLEKYKDVFNGFGKENYFDYQHEEPEEKLNTVNDINAIKEEIKNIDEKFIEQNKNLREIHDILDITTGEIVNLKNSISSAIELIEKIKTERLSSNDSMQAAEEENAVNTDQPVIFEDQKNDLIS